MKFSPLFILLAVTLAACGNKETAPVVAHDRPALTRIAGDYAGSWARQYSGEIRARHEISLGFRIGGKLIERQAETGMRVKAGQILARLDPADSVLQTAAITAQYQLARDEAIRYRKLRGQGFVSQSALDAKEAALKSVDAQAALARNQSEYTVLRAAQDGIVTATFADAGQVVGSGQAVLHLARAGEMEVGIEIPESQLMLHHTGDRAGITLLSGAHITGRLRELSPAADPVSRTYAARISLDAAPEQAALGMTARVDFGNAATSQALIVPLSAIYQQDKKTAVWIVASDRSVSLRPVEVEAYRDQGAVIAAGLKAGERFVSAGVHRLAAGEKIQLIESNP